MPIKISTNTMLRLTLLVFSCLQMVYYFLPLKPIFYISMAILTYTIAASLFTLSKSGRIIVLVLLVLAAVLLISSGASFAQWLEGMGKNGLLVAFFTLAGLLHLPFSYEDYQSELKNVAKLYMHTMLPFNFLIAIPTHIFAALTGFAAFAIMYNLFLETSKLYDAEDIFVATLGRSYSTSGFWGTSWVSVVLVVSELHIAWYRIIIVGIIMTAVSILINLLSIKIKIMRSPGRYPTLAPDTDTKVQWKRIWIMATLAVSIVVITLVINQITGWSLLAIVPIVSVLFPVVTAIIQNKRKELKRGVENFMQNTLYKGRVNACIFTAAGMLAYALDISGIGAKIPGLIPDMFIGRPLLLIITIILLIIVPGQMGIHPVAVGTTLVATIVPAALGLTLQQFAMAIICGWLLSNMLSPFSALNLTLSGLTGRSTWQTGLKLNWRYGLVCIFVYSFMIMVLSPLLGNPVS